MTRTVHLDRTMTQADFDAFARLSGDANPIHVDPDFAARTRFGKTVAHGAFLCAILRGLVDELAPGGTQKNQAVMFPNSAPVGETVRFEARIIDTDAGRSAIALTAIRLSDGKPACEGRTDVET
tara:strand:- start:562 stop:933 length:372 start_codon:yes stop_codon:yes gene_type:complete